eukprot:365706-Chlamydomonas_euryale.AAC.13
MLQNPCMTSSHHAVCAIAWPSPRDPIPHTCHPTLRCRVAHACVCPTPPQGVNIMAFCKEYNAKTSTMAGQVIPVEITVYEVWNDSRCGRSDVFVWGGCVGMADQATLVDTLLAQWCGRARLHACVSECCLNGAREIDM